MAWVTLPLENLMKSVIKILENPGQYADRMLDYPKETGGDVRIGWIDAIVSDLSRRENDSSWSVGRY